MKKVRIGELIWEYEPKGQLSIGRYVVVDFPSLLDKPEIGVIISLFTNTCKVAIPFSTGHTFYEDEVYKVITVNKYQLMPIKISVRVKLDKETSDVELSYYSFGSISPIDVINGKLISGVITTIKTKLKGGDTVLVNDSKSEYVNVKFKLRDTNIVNNGVKISIVDSNIDDEFSELEFSRNQLKKVNDEDSKSIFSIHCEKCKEIT